MSDDELEKLAAEMQNINPSKSARKRGMDAAMAAFDAEFARENVQASEASQEKNSAPTQGLETSPRLTEQTTHNTTLVDRVQSFGRDTMSKTRKIFAFNQKSAMMMGSCAAALVASFIYIESSSFDTEITQKPAIAVADNTAGKNTAQQPLIDVPTVVTPKVDRSTIETPKAKVPNAPKPKAAAPRVRTPDTKISETKNTPVPPLPVPPSPVVPDIEVQEVIVTGSQSSAAGRGLKDRPEVEAFASDSIMGQNSISQPLAPSPVISQPSTSQPSTSQASTSQPSTSQPSTSQPSTSQPSTSQPSTSKPARTVPPAPIAQRSQALLKMRHRADISVAPRYPRPRPEDEAVIVQPSNDKFGTHESNPVTSAQDTPVSTFSIDVDTASYSFLRASINRGQLPPPSSIRLEEMINYFPYDYDAPKSADEPFKANVTITPTPWNADTKLMHIGIKGYTPPVAERPPSNIVLLIDTSGSMRAQNKLPLLINSFKLLLGTLDEDDTVSIVTYAGSAGTVLEPTPANETGKIKAALSNLRSGGSTAGAAGLELAYNKALETFDKDGVNRVILATDGDFNVGFSSHDEMKTFIEKKRKTGIFLSVLGFGQGNYNDQLMQSLAQNGNGVAAYIDTLAEAQKVLADETGSVLFTIAKDVKIQVEFNPSVVSEYRLIGYESRALKRQDFNNDKVDAGEINAGHSVTAIYEMTPVGSPAQTIDTLRYTSSDTKPIETGSDEYAFVKIRHKRPTSDTSTLQTFPVGNGQERSLKRASKDMRFATAVAAAGQKLRGDTQLDDFSYEDVITLAKKARGDDEHGYRAEFIQIVRLIDGLQGE